MRPSVFRLPVVVALVVASATTAGLASPAAGVAPESPAFPLTQSRCSDYADPVPFAAGTDDFENLHFHDGLLYATGSDGLLHAFAPDGTDSVIANLGARSGAMVTGHDGALYVRQGSAAGEIWRFANLPSSAHTVIAAGIPGANGLGLDAAGNLYVSNEAQDIFRLPASNPAAWSSWAKVAGANGLVVDDDAPMPAGNGPDPGPDAGAGVVYAAITDDQRSSIVAVSLADPTDVRDVAHLSFGAVRVGVFERPPPVEPRPANDPLDPRHPAVFKALDDLTLGPDGYLYAAAWMTSELLRVDPATGSVCVVASGLDAPSSVRVAAGFGAFDGDLFVTTFGGNAGLVFPLPGTIVRVPLG